jgi:hypothetical protein
MNTVPEKKPYLPPLLEVYEYVVERGFADSPQVSHIETFSEINDESGIGHHGENYHGEWY